MDAMMEIGAEPITIADFPELDALAEEENATEIMGDKPLSKVDMKRKARMRPKGSYKQVRLERG
jgi:hypothetical protein